jgi:uncharacterized protein
MGSTLVALCTFDLRIPGVRSLKEKRHVVKTLTASLRRTFNVSVAEVGHHDLWQRTSIAVSSVAGEGHHLRRVVQEIEHHVDRWVEVEIIDVGVSYHGPED